MSFEAIDLEFSKAVAQLRSGRKLDLIVSRGSGLVRNKQKIKIRFFNRDFFQDLITRDLREQQQEENTPAKVLEDEAKLLQSQVQLERRKLEAEQERLKREAEKIEAEKVQLEREKQKLKKSESSGSSQR